MISVRSSDPNEALVAHLDEGLHFTKMLFPGSYLAKQSITHNEAAHLTCLDFSHSGASLEEPLLAGGTDHGLVQIFSVAELCDEARPRLRALAALPARLPVRGRCRSISWNPHANSTHLLASGYDKGSTRDAGVAVFNAGQSLGVHTTKPIAGGAHGESVTAVKWLDQDRLAVGTSNKWLKLWDIRSPPETAIRVMAHNKAVRGVACDPLRPALLATHSDGHLEPVCVWDARKLEEANPTPWATIRPFAISSATNSTVVQVEWSPHLAGTLALASSEYRHLTLWSVTQGGTLVTPTQVHTTVSPVRCLAFAPHAAGTLLYVPMNKDQERATAHAEGQDRQTPGARIVAANVRGFEPLSISVQGSVAANAPPPLPLPLAPPPQPASSGMVVGGGGSIRISSFSAGSDGWSDDVSLRMKARALAGYSVDTGRNLQIIFDELDNTTAAMTGTQEQAKDRHSTESGEGDEGQDEGLRCQHQELTRLFRFWTWVERVERRMGGITEAGVDALLRNHSAAAPQSSALEFDPALHCRTYTSPGRRRVLAACGWATTGMPPSSSEAAAAAATAAGGNVEGGELLASVLLESEGGGGSSAEHLLAVDRAAWLALVHCDLPACLACLRRVEGGGMGPQAGAPQVRLLMAMCVAGFSAQPQPLWLDSAKALAQGPAGYLHSIARFLLAAATAATAAATAGGTSGTSGQVGGGEEVYFALGFGAVLGDEGLALEDRVGIAARFLDDDALLAWVEEERVKRSGAGDLEGLLLTGLDDGGDGLELLQNYVDKTGDVQTLALIGCRVEPFVREEGFAAASLLVEGAEWYRDLLDRLQLWEERAVMDSGRATLLREKGAQGAAAPTLLVGEDAHTGERAGLFVRCNFCNTPLPLSRLCQQQGLQNKSWLQNQKPVLSCCPSCRNHLPRCYVCLMALNSINPFLELKRQRAAAREPLSSLDFSQWHTWCQLCKHGGHADHVNEWFQRHTTCGVSGCNCHCSSL